MVAELRSGSGRTHSLTSRATIGSTSESTGPSRFPAVRCSSPQPRSSRFTATFPLLPFAAPSLDGLLIPRSEVRSLPGPPSKFLLITLLLHDSALRSGLWGNAWGNAVVPGNQIHAAQQRVSSGSGSGAAISAKEWRRSRTYPAVGYTTSPVLKVCTARGLMGPNRRWMSHLRSVEGGWGQLRWVQKRVQSSPARPQIQDRCHSSPAPRRRPMAA
jgi:hypothetical protein